MKRLSSSQLRKVLSGLVASQSYREIAEQVQINKSTVGRVMSAASQSGKGVKALLELDDNELINAVYPPELGSREEPDWMAIHKQLQRKNVTLRMLFDRYTAEATKEIYNYSSFCRRYDQWRRDNGILTVGGNVERVPGQRMEIDFAGDLLAWIDDNGCVQRCKLFVATLPYSNIIFTEAFADETQASWINGIVDALEYFGAVPEVLVMDNARALVNRDGWRDGDAHTAIRSLCSYYGMEPWACKPATPKQKNRVEAAVHDVERWIIAELTLDSPLVASDLRDVNAQIRKRLDAINTQSFRAKHAQGSRRMLYEREEKVHMRALPAMPYDPGDWKLLTVDKAHCVRIASEAGHRYSTPAAYVGKKVAVLSALRWNIKRCEPVT